MFKIYFDGTTAHYCTAWFELVVAHVLAFTVMHQRSSTSLAASRTALTCHGQNCHKES